MRFYSIVLYRTILSSSLTVERSVCEPSLLANITADELTPGSGGGAGRGRDRERRGRSPLTKQSRSVDLLAVPGHALSLQPQAETPPTLSLAPSSQTLLTLPAARSPPHDSTATLVSTGSAPSAGSPAASGSGALPPLFSRVRPLRSSTCDWTHRPSRVEPTS